MFRVPNMSKAFTAVRKTAPGEANALTIRFSGKQTALYYRSISANAFTGLATTNLLRSFAQFHKNNNGSSSNIQIDLRSINRAFYSTPAENKPTSQNLPTTKPAQPPAKPVEKKLTLWEKVKHEANHYWDGTKLFGKEIKISTKLVIKMLRGTPLSRREDRQLKRTLSDLVRLVPFSLFVIVPFAELLLPFALKIFPNLLPSTYEDAKTAEAKKLKFQKTRQEVSKYLRDTIKEGLESKKQRLLEVEDGTVAKNEDIFKQVEATLTEIRASGSKVKPEEVAKLASIFQDDLTLDNLTRPQLISVCRYLDISSYGTDNYIKYTINKRLKYIRADDHIIRSEGLDTLTVTELRSACIARGIKTVGESPAKMKEGLQRWIQMHLEFETPAIFLILSRILSAGDQTAKPSVDIIQATLSSLPESLVNEATLAMAEEQGTATNKLRLEVLEEQEELIEDEEEQEEKHIKSKQASTIELPQPGSSSDSSASTSEPSTSQSAEASKTIETPQDSSPTTTATTAPSETQIPKK